MNNNKKSLLVKKIFLISFVAILLLVLINYIRGPREIIHLENRTAYQMPSFNLKDYFNGTYQENLENAFSDQAFLSERLKKYFLITKNEIFYFLTNLNKTKDYKLVTKDLYSYNNDDYLLYRKWDINEEALERIENFFNQVLVENKYLYFINSDASLDFNNINNDYYDSLIKYFKNFKTSYLNVDSFDTYKNYFYKTDHHWNYQGSYQGYKDIIKMIKGEEEVLKPIKEVELKYNIYGSKALGAQFYFYKEKFKAYDFSIPSHKTYVNGEEKEYGKQKLYLEDKVNTDSDYNLTYGEFYGYDSSEIIYDFENESEDNLLIIGYSETNAINELIASHFNKTFVLDPRYVADNLNLNDYIKENNIKNLLFMGSANSILQSVILKMEV